MHAHSKKHLYDNGCAMCDAVQTLHETIKHGSGVPWATEAYVPPDFRKHQSIAQRAESARYPG